MLTHSCFFAGILLAWLINASPVAAQVHRWESASGASESLLKSVAPKSSEKGGFCFKCRPSPQCGSFLITEFGYLKRFARSGYFESGNDRDFYVLGEVGWMKNIDEKNAIGTTVYYGFDDDASELAIKPRYRRWLTPRVNLDISAGPIIKTFNDWRYNVPGFTGQVGLGFGDAALVITQVNVIPYDLRFEDGGAGKPDTETVWYGGAKLSSYPGTAALILVPLTTAVLWIIAMSGTS
jgi:hypothetical protein